MTEIGAIYNDDGKRVARYVPKGKKPRHAGADGACPDYGSKLDPCLPGCASGTCVATNERTKDAGT